MQTTTKRDLCEKIVRKTNNSQLLVKETIQMFLDRIVEELSQGNRIELRDFGVFEVKKRAARKARNPRTGEEAFVPAKKCRCLQGGKINERKSKQQRNQ